jgi:hypothetical protein
LQDPAIAALQDLLRTAAWQEKLAATPGYAPQHSGEVLSLRAVLPWWSFSRAKPAPKVKHSA